MTAAYFEDHPTDPDKVILRKPKHDFGEPWSPVSIGVDVTKEGAHVVGIYAMSDETSQVFYSKFYPAPQRTWVGLTRTELIKCGVLPFGMSYELYEAIEDKLREKNS